MNRRLSGDASLNAPIRASEGESGEWQDWLVDDHDSAETMLIEQDELENRRGMLSGALSVLNERERRIFEARRLSDEPKVAGDELVGSAGVLMLLVPLGEHVLFLRLKHREPTDFLKVAGKPAFSGNDTG